MGELRGMFALGIIAGIGAGLVLGWCLAHYVYSGDAERQQQVHRLRCAQHTTTPAMLEFCVTGDEEAVR